LCGVCVGWCGCGFGCGVVVVCGGGVGGCSTKKQFLLSPGTLPVIPCRPACSSVTVLTELGSTSAVVCAV